jgi:hypothetical protein
VMGGWVKWVWTEWTGLTRWTGWTRGGYGSVSSLLEPMRLLNRGVRLAEDLVCLRGRRRDGPRDGHWTDAQPTWAIRETGAGGGRRSRGECDGVRCLAQACEDHRPSAVRRSSGSAASRCGCASTSRAMSARSLIALLGRRPGVRHAFILPARVSSSEATRSRMP